MLNVLKQIGMYTCTGIGAIVGLVAGAIVFRPKNVTFNCDKKDEQNEEAN